MTPDTRQGQLLTVLYSLIGLPISMLVLKTIGELIVNCVQALVLAMEKRILNSRHVGKIKLKTFLATCVLMIIFILLGSIIEVLLEGWTFTEGIYTWFVTFSTIGFGDYIPFQSLDEKDNHIGRIWVFIFSMGFFTMAGLCVVSAVLTSLVQAVEEWRSKSKAYRKLVQLVKTRRNRVLRSALYRVNRACDDPSYHTVSLGMYRRVRSRSI